MIACMEHEHECEQCGATEDLCEHPALECIMCRTCAQVASHFLYELKINPGYMPVNGYPDDFVRQCLRALGRTEENLPDPTTYSDY